MIFIKTVSPTGIFIFHFEIEISKSIFGIIKKNQSVNMNFSNALNLTCLVSLRRLFEIVVMSNWYSTPGLEKMFFLSLSSFSLKETVCHILKKEQSSYAYWNHWQRIWIHFEILTVNKVRNFNNRTRSCASPHIGGPK